MGSFNLSWGSEMDKLIRSVVWLRSCNSTRYTHNRPMRAQEPSPMQGQLIKNAINKYPPTLLNDAEQKQAPHHGSASTHHACGTRVYVYRSMLFIISFTNSSWPPPCIIIIQEKAETTTAEARIVLEVCFMQIAFESCACKKKQRSDTWMILADSSM